MGRDYGPPADWSNEFEKLQRVISEIPDERIQQIARCAANRGMELYMTNRELMAEISGIRSQLREQLRCESR